MSRKEKILQSIREVLFVPNVPQTRELPGDVPWVIDDEPYITNYAVPLPGFTGPQNVYEAEGETEIRRKIPQPEGGYDEYVEKDVRPGDEIEDEDEPPMTPDEADADVPPGMEQPGIDPMTGMPMEEPKTPDEIGKIYEMKRIYARLLAIESYLSELSDLQLIKLRNYVSQSIELFETLMANIDVYKDNLTEKIEIYYRFLERTYAILQKFYEIKTEEDKNKDEFFPQKV